MLDVFKWVIDAGAVVFLPILIAIFGIVLGVKPGKALMSGVTVGIGFIGLNLVIGLVSGGLGKAVQLMGQNYDLHMKIMDIGSGLGSPLAYSTQLGLIAIPTSIGLNILFIVLGLTKTLNIDIWNFWYPIFNGLVATQITNSFWIGYATVIVCFFLQWMMADFFSEKVAKFYNLTGVTVSHMMSLSGAVIALPLNWLFDRIPGFKDLDASPESIKKRFGVFGDTTFMGMVIGIIVGFLANYDVAGAIELGITTGAVMKLMPKMVAMFMEGLKPIADAATQFANKRLGGKKVNIGMDSAIIVGHPAVMATGLVLVPAALLLAIILPGNEVLPFGDIAFFAFAICLMVPIFKGNMVRSIVAGVIYLISMIYASNYLAPVFTSVLETANYDVGEATGMVTSIMVGLWPTVLIKWTLDNIGWIILPVFMILTVFGLFLVNRKGKESSVNQTEQVEGDA